MPRRGGGGMGGRTSSPPPRATPVAQAPPRAPAPTQEAPRGGIFSGLAGTFATGMAFGAGSEIAHQAIRGVMGGGSHSQPQVVYAEQPAQTQSQRQTIRCESENTSFLECMRRNTDSISACQPYIDVLKECEKKY
eukprot:TRINITY_DN0_c113_g1_i5.p1 TRINITY_DN0_c113_g1~~TRINITY_DN0_c113_g1_i5.p1  ORF type:complete len:135 (-),score=31.76 TRINITY_DN0_c113_g1_i5:44-448(-)